MHDFKEPYYEGKECKCCKKELRQELAFAVGWDEGEQRERERIIELLEKEKARTGLGFVQYNVIYSLIKGENK
jgi:hypothetical protein